MNKLEKVQMKPNNGEFHLYLFKLTFTNQFYSIMTRLVSAAISKLLVQESFHKQFKIFWYGVSLKMRGIF